MFEAAPISHSLQSPKVLDRAGNSGLFTLNGLRSGTGLLLIATVACWLLFFNQLRGEWAVNAQYNYGYMVPLLGLALIWRRWPARPSVSPPSEGLLPNATAAFLLFLVLPFGVILEANPEWRLIYWLNGFQVVGLAMYFLYRLGGWNWSRYFAAPLLFMLIAVPWPMGLETSVIQGLMRFVAGLTVEVAGLLGIPAVQLGNLIQVKEGIVGIDEACSGVRSLQSALMLSLFLGEMNRFSWPRRAALLGSSLLFVLFANLCRTSFLVWAAATRGLEQMEKWHDTAGILVMLIALPGLMALAHFMKPKPSSTTPAPEPVHSPVQTLPMISRWPGTAALVWIVLSQVVIEAWYRTHESNLVDNTRWTVAWPVQNPEFKKSAVPDNSLAILRCSNSDAASWLDDGGNQWSAFMLRWDPGKNSVQLAKGHRPDICLPASGARLVDDFGQTNIQAGGFELPFRHQSFESGARLIHVFYCLWSDKRAPNQPVRMEEEAKDLTLKAQLKARVDAVMDGKRHLGQQVLEIVIAGPDSSDEAVSTLKQQLPNLIHRL
jgi:exosortase